MNRIKKFIRDVNSEIKENRNTFLVYVVMRLFVIIIMILQILNQNYENVFLCILTLALMIMPSVFQATFKVDLPSVFEIIILIFIFAAEILGELSSFYLLYPHWDTILHTINGFLCAAIGFSLMDIMNKDDRIKFKMAPAFLAIVAFCFSMTIGVCWEFFEFGCDQILHTDTQKDSVVEVIYSTYLDEGKNNEVVVIDNINSLKINDQELSVDGYLDIGLIDTMHDLIVNFIGASVFSTLGYFYIKNRNHGIVEKLLLRVKR